MKCPVCGGAELKDDTRDLLYLYKGASTVIENVMGDFCPTCDEPLLDAYEAARTSELMMDFNKEINPACVDPLFITQAQRSLAWINLKRLKYLAEV